jgi:peroxidase
MRRQPLRYPCLNIEHLESREMMAADLTGSVLAAHASAIDTSAQQAVSQQTAARQATVVIPVTTAKPRSYDGTGNNLAHPEWGSTDEQLLRAAEADYADGIATPAGEDRPSAREISNALVAQLEEEPNDRNLSAFIYVWGQFIDHDMDLTEPPATGREAFNVAVPSGDEYFDPASEGSKWINLNRSRYDVTTGTSVDNPREQVNQITAWIDASMIYGSSQATADSLRTFAGGKLKTSTGNLPPTDAAGNFLAGDARANENVELTSMHALFVREHNWWATQIARQNPRLGDEAIYQQARAIVIAEIQTVTYNEFLPALLGTGAVDRYRGYKASVDPSIANEFSTAAFRMHSLINDDVEFFGNDGRAVRDEVSLAEAFFNPALLRATGADSIIKYLASTTAQEIDSQIVDSLRNFLFGQPGQGGFDLASLNIQRGRDHGLADYNSVREAYGLARVTSFAEITSDVALQESLETLYESVDNIDLWVGGLVEDHVPNSSVGETIRAIVSDQFERLRDGDRMWFERIFSGRQLDQIENTSLADIIRRNTSVSNIQENVFFLNSVVTGQAFLDANNNGRQDRVEVGIPGLTVELLDDEGAVAATTVTNARGRYSFSEFQETGDYQVRVVVPSRLRATTATTRAALVSRGDLTVAGLDFGLRVVGRQNGASPREPQLAAVDSAFAERAVDPFGGLDTSVSRQAKRGGKPR